MKALKKQRKRFSVKLCGFHPNITPILNNKLGIMKHFAPYSTFTVYLLLLLIIFFFCRVI